LPLKWKICLHEFYKKQRETETENRYFCGKPIVCHFAEVGLEMSLAIVEGS
jgi:hypothetical protein